MAFKQKVLIAGGVAGALIGLAAAFLYLKTNESKIAALEAGESESMNKVSPGEALAVGLSIVTLLRQIVGLGQS